MADAGHLAATVKHERKFAGSIADLDLDCRNSGARLNAHATDLSAHINALTKRHVGQRQHVQVFEAFTETLCDKVFFRW